MATPRPRHAWLPELLSRLTAASGVGYLLTAYVVSRWLTRRAPGKPRLTPTDLGLPWEPLTCRTADGLCLAGWAAEPARPLGTVMLFHGLRHNREHTLSRLALLVRAGYRCVAFDHRAHGGSDGRRTSFGFHEAEDVAAVHALVRRRWPGQPCAALGVSMGAAAICFASRRTGAFDALILESLYQDIASTFLSRLQTVYPPWFRRFAPGIVRMTEWRLGARIENIAPIKHIEHLAPTPVLLMTGTEDAHATPDQAKRLFERCRGPRELWLIEGAGHKNVLDVAGPAYAERVVDFLRRRLVA